MLIFKGILKANGVNAIDFMLIRCLVVFVVACLGVVIFGKSPFPPFKRCCKEKTCGEGGGGGDDGLHGNSGYVSEGGQSETDKKEEKPEVIENDPYIFWFRHLAGNGAYFLNILAMSKLPLGISMILFNTAPFWSIIFGKLINKSTVTNT